MFSIGFDLGVEVFVGSGDVESFCIFKGEYIIQLICKDVFIKKVSMLVEFLLEKFQKSEQFIDFEMLKVVSKKYKIQFFDIVRKFFFCMEMIFGMQLKKINSSSEIYVIVSKFGFFIVEILSVKRGLLKMGFLMIILGYNFYKR